MDKNRKILSDLIARHEQALNLLEDGKEIPAYRKFQGIKDKLYLLLIETSQEKIKKEDEKDNNS